MRHAKTESPYTLKRDIHRRLTDTGIHEATRMGEWMSSQQIQVDRIESSPAERTRQTAERVLEAMKLNHSILHFREDLYHATPDIFYRTILALPDDAHRVLIVSHNNGITDFANELTDTRIDFMQPGSIFAVESAALNWQEWASSVRTFLFYKQPS